MSIFGQPNTRPLALQKAHGIEEMATPEILRKHAEMIRTTSWSLPIFLQRTAELLDSAAQILERPSPEQD